MILITKTLFNFWYFVKNKEYYYRYLPKPAVTPTLSYDIRVYKGMK